MVCKLYNQKNKFIFLIMYYKLYNQILYYNGRQNKI